MNAEEIAKTCVEWTDGRMLPPLGTLSTSQALDKVARALLVCVETLEAIATHSFAAPERSMARTALSKIRSPTP